MAAKERFGNVTVGAVFGGVGEKSAGTETSGVGVVGAVGGERCTSAPSMVFAQTAIGSVITLRRVDARWRVEDQRGLRRGGTGGTVVFGDDGGEARGGKSETTAVDGALSRARSGEGLREATSR